MRSGYSGLTLSEPGMVEGSLRIFCPAQAWYREFLLWSGKRQPAVRLFLVRQYTDLERRRERNADVRRRDVQGAGCKRAGRIYGNTGKQKKYGTDHREISV